MTTDSQTPGKVVELALEGRFPHSPLIVSAADLVAEVAIDALRAAGYAVVQPAAHRKWLTPGTAYYDHLNTKCALAGWAAYRQPGTGAERSDAVVRATLDTVRDILDAADRGES